MSTSVVIESTLKACQDTLETIKTITQANFDEKARYASEYTAWQILTSQRATDRQNYVIAMENQFNRDKNLKTNPYTSSGQWVWAGNTAYDCNTLKSLDCGGVGGLCGYCRGFGEKGEAKQRCQACYDGQCACLLGQGLCTEGCISQFYINDTWPAPFYVNRVADSYNKYPIPPAPRPASFLPIIENIVCAACQQSISIGTITADSVSMEPITQAQNCISGLQSKLAVAKSAEQAAADAAAAAAEAERLKQLQAAKEKAQTTGIPDPKFPETIAIANTYWHDMEVKAAIEMIKLAGDNERKRLDEQEKFAKTVEEVKKIRQQKVDSYNKQVEDIKKARIEIAAKFKSDLIKAADDYLAAEKQKKIILILILIFIVAAVFSAMYFAGGIATGASEKGLIQDIWT